MSTSGTIIAFLGGPGIAGADLVRSGFQLPAALDASFDLVVWNLPGTGVGASFTCGGGERQYQRDGALADQATTSGGTTAGAVAAACSRHLATQPVDLSSEAVVRQAEEVRRTLLGPAATVSLLGLSYGTVPAVEYAAAYPGHVGRVLLDGVVDPYLPGPVWLSAQARSMGSRLREWSGAHAFEGQMNAVARAAVGSGPPRIGVADHLRLGDLETATMSVLEHADNREPFWSQLGLAAKGDATDLAYTALRFYGSYSYSAYLGTMCADWRWPGAAAWPAFTRALVAAAGSRVLGSALAADLAPCASWPNGSVGSKVPAISPALTGRFLVVSEEGDVVTPASLAHDLSSHLPTPVRLQMSSTEHTSVLTVPCVASLAVAFFQARSMTNAASCGRLSVGAGAS